MLRSVCLPVFISISIFTALPAQGAILSALPMGADEYEKVFGYEPTPGELDSIQSSQPKDGQPRQYMRTLEDFQKVLDSPEQVLILVGHNEKGDFRFASGESKPIAQLSEMVGSSGKIGVFLTCRGSCYTDAPAPRFKINWIDAFALAAVLNHTFAHDPPYERDSGPSRPNPDAPPRPSLFTPAKHLTLSECAQQFIQTPRGNRAKLASQSQRLKHEIRKTIFRAEATKIVSTRAKVVAATGSTGAIVWGVFNVFLDDD